MQSIRPINKDKAICKAKEFLTSNVNTGINITNCVMVLDVSTKRDYELVPVHEDANKIILSRLTF